MWPTLTDMCIDIYNAFHTIFVDTASLHTLVILSCDNLNIENFVSACYLNSGSIVYSSSLLSADKNQKIHAAKQTSYFEPIYNTVA